MDVVALNEAFASQGLAVLRQLGLPDDAEHVIPNGGAIALGPPLGDERRAAGAHGHRGVPAPQGPLRAMHHVHRCGPGIAMVTERC